MPDERDQLNHSSKEDSAPKLPSQEDTEPLLFLDDEEIAKATLRRDDDDFHEQPTEPLQPTQGQIAADMTLAGSGGLDPNPDFAQNTAGSRSDQTVISKKPAEKMTTQAHIKPFEHTIVHVPDERKKQNVQPAPPRPNPAPLASQPPRYTSAQPAPNTQPQASHQPAQQYRGQMQPNALRPPSQPTYPNQPQPTIPAPPRERQATIPAPMPYNTVQNQGRYGAQPPQNRSQRLPPRKRRRVLGCTPGCFMILAGVLFTFCGGITLMTLTLAAALGSRLEERMSVEIARVDEYNNFQSTFFYDRNGALLYEAFNEGRRVGVDYADFPQDLINATIAIEDDTFFTNPGFEVEATIRAMLQYVGLAEGSSGGSTITQQLVRNVLFEPEYRAERSIQRKIEEIILAFLLRQRKSPEEVLEMYLNEIYYGNLAYGAEAAAQTFFGKSVGELTLGEAALLAGLPQAPANLDPFNPDPQVQAAVFARWYEVLNRMVAEGFISTAQRDAAIAQGLTLVEPAAPLEAPHFTVYAMDEYRALMESLGYSPQDIAAGGYRVTTTVDLPLNELAQRTAANQVATLAGNNVSNAAVIIMQPQTGEILAMVGSIDYHNDAIDGRVNVTISLRQPGSTMKPFTYSAALEQGMTPGDIIWDTPTRIADYTPVNYDGTFHGPVRLRTALANSYNIPAVQTLRRVGVESLLEIMRRFGVESLGMDASHYGLSLTLGGGDITLLELTNAYGVFANGGEYVPNTAILCVLDRHNNIVYEYQNGCSGGAPVDTTVFNDGYPILMLDPRIAYFISDVLADEPARQPAMGYHSALYTGDIEASVKTGTTNDFRDNWTVGYTRNMVIGVWVGNSDGTPMSRVSGLAGAAPIWNSLITTIHNDPNLLANFAVNGALEPNRLDPPGGMSLRNICSVSAMRDPVLNCSSQVTEWFLDTPAGLPDGTGSLYFPPAPEPTPDQPPPSGVWLREVEPDIYRVLVHPIPNTLGISIQVAPGQTQPPPPIYCQVPVELAPYDPGAREQLFLAPPLDPSDAASAEQYARNNGFAFLPTIACNQELVSAAAVNAPIAAFISSPANGQAVFGPFDILGTAQFTPEQAQYYKIEIYGGPFTNWTTVNTIHNNSVVNGVLEQMPALSPGVYQLQLVVVGRDGNYVQPPYQITVQAQ